MSRETRVPANWIEDGYYHLPYVCSNCGVAGKQEYRFCPWCGARIVVMSSNDSSAPTVREEK